MFCSESAIKGTELFATDSNVDKVDKPYYVYIRINGLCVKMEVDMGAAVHDFRKIVPLPFSQGKVISH